MCCIVNEWHWFNCLLSLEKRWVISALQKKHALRPNVFYYIRNICDQHIGITNVIVVEADWILSNCSVNDWAFALSNSNSPFFPVYLACSSPNTLLMCLMPCEEKHLLNDKIAGNTMATGRLFSIVSSLALLKQCSIGRKQSKLTMWHRHLYMRRLWCQLKIHLNSMVL